MKINELIMLARVMSQRFGVSVSLAKDCLTARAGRKILEDGSEVYDITLPIIEDKGKYDKMVRGFLDHELGHVRYTDYSEFPDLQQGDYCREMVNIFEDVFIEARMGKDYPGSKINMSWLARQLFTPQSAAASVRDIYKNGSAIEDVLEYFSSLYALYKRRAQNDPELAHSHDLLDQMKDFLCQLAPEAKEFFRVLDDALATPVNCTRDSKELGMRIADALRKCATQIAQNKLKQNQDQQMQMPNMGGSSQSQEQEQGEEQQDSQSDSGQSGSDSGQQEGQQDSPQGEGGSDSGQGEEQDAGSSGQASAGSGAGDTSQGSGAKQKAKVKKEMIKAAREAAQKLGADQYEPTSGVTDIVSAFNSVLHNNKSDAEISKELADSRDMCAFMRMLKESKGAECSPYSRPMTVDESNNISLLQAGFMRTIPPLLQSIQYKPCKVGFSGRLSTRDLYKVGVNNGRIFNRRAERKEQAIDVGILLDASGSMKYENVILQAHTCLYAMLNMLKTLPKVRAFAYAYSMHYTPLSKVSEKKITSYRMIEAGGGTPTAGAVLRILPEFNVHPDTRRVLFIITDGDPDDSRALVKALGIARKQGVEVYGIVLRQDIPYYKEQFGADKYVAVTELNKLPTHMVDMMRKALLCAVQ